MITGNDLRQMPIFPFVGEHKFGRLSLLLNIVISEFVGHPLDHLVQLTRLLEMIANGLVTYRNGGCEFTRRLRLVMLHFLVLAVVTSPRTTATWRCIFKDLVSRSKAFALI